MELVIRATAVYWFLWLVVRGIGKRSLAELTPLDLLAIVVLGDFVQQAVTQEDMSVTGGLIAVATFVLWTLAGDRIAKRAKPLAEILDGHPVVIVNRGAIVDAQLRSEAITREDVLGAARQHGFGDLAEVEFAVMETDGTFSFVPARGPSLKRDQKPHS